MKVPFSYLERQFNDIDPILAKIKELVQTADFTLGKDLETFEHGFANICNTKHAIGVGTGTDALILSLKALGIGPGDEVITVPNTFYATVGAIDAVGAKPVFVDSNDFHVINEDLIENAITPKTKAILPVHLYGCPAYMPKILEIAKNHNLKVVEDSCQAISAEIDGKRTGSFGDAGGFSLHPLKNLNVWGDGGIIVTNSDELNDKLRKIRNHGLVNRDECEFWGINCRLDSLQAVVGNHLMKDTDFITNERIKNAQFYDSELSTIPQITIPMRRLNVRHVFHTYVVKAERRDELLNFLIENGVEAKVHYPIPMHLQMAAKDLGYKKGDFPVAEAQSESIITLPHHQHLTAEEKEYVVTKIKEFYK
ncbi:DegT/DnrJ/EryC1/StrS family aminotransferase [Nanoarchaeota archaeon]